MLKENEKDRIFRLFLDANNLEPRGDFSRRVVVYDTPSGALSGEELQNTKAYSGFVDGYMGNEPKRAQGRAKERDPTGLGDAEIKVEFEDSDREDENWGSFGISDVRSAGGYDYDYQYTLGVSMRGERC